MNTVIQINIATDNAAFEPDWQHEVSRILKRLAEKLDNGLDEDTILRDINGNRAGELLLSTENEE